MTAIGVTPPPAASPLKVRGGGVMTSLITDNLDLWTSALLNKSTAGRGSNGKQEAYGIKKLRALILELAVRGKLVAQDPNDEPASKLLAKIAKEKARLLKEGKIKKQKQFTAITDEEAPFNIPEKWVWQRLGAIGYTQTGGTPSKTDKSFFGKDIPFIKPGDIYPNFVDYNNEGLSFKGAEILGRIAPKDSILMVCIGTIGKCNAIDWDCSFNQQINSVTPFLSITKYLLTALSSKYFQYTAWNSSSSTTIAILNKGNWEEIVVPLPPLPEQHRIVAKVDELMSLCDQLEEQQSNSNAAHQTLVETLLSTLTSATDHSESAEAWQRVASHFDTLFTTEHSIDQLKQTILQLAVMGKLVPQDPNEEPASVLLGKIAKEKARLIKEGKIKKQKPLPEITDEDRQFELPEKWVWVRLGYITSKITDGDHKTPPRISEGYRLLSAKNVRDGYLDFDNCDFISEESYRKSRERCCPEADDLLIVSVGGTIGRTSLVPADTDFALVRSVALIKPLLINSSYLKYAMDSSLLQNSIHARKRGGAQPCLYLSEIEMFDFSLPPIAEQHRIVTKVDELMALCDSLKDRINEAQTTKIQLADAIVEQAVA